MSKFPPLSMTEESNPLALAESVMLEEERYKINFRTG